MIDNRTNGHKGDQTGLKVLTTDDVFKLLSNYRRREVLELLREHGPMNKRALAESIDGEYKPVYISLHQCHLPKLVRGDVLTEDRDTYALGPNADELLAYIDGPIRELNLRQTIAGFVTP